MVITAAESHILRLELPMSGLQSYFQRWDLKEAVLLNVTPTSDLYKVQRNGKHAVLKILTNIGCEDEKNSGIALQSFAGYGAVRLFEHDEKALLMEYLDGDDLIKRVDNGQDTEATEIIADTLIKLHKAPIHPPQLLKLLSLRERFLSLYNFAQSLDATEEGKMLKRAAQLADYLLSEEANKVLLHGDMHHGNVIDSSSRGWLAIDPKGLYGEKTYDAANTLYNPNENIVLRDGRLFQTAEILARKLGCDFNRILAYGYVHGCLSAAWSIEVKQDPRPALNVAKIIADYLAKKRIFC